MTSAREIELTELQSIQTHNECITNLLIWKLELESKYLWNV